MRKTYREKAESKLRNIRILQRQMLSKYGVKSTYETPAELPSRVTKKRYKNIELGYKLVKAEMKRAQEEETHAHFIVRTAHEERVRSSPNYFKELGRKGNVALQQKLAKLPEEERNKFYRERSLKAAETRRKKAKEAKQKSKEPVTIEVDIDIDEKGEIKTTQKKKQAEQTEQEAVSMAKVIKENFGEIMALYEALMREMDFVGDQYLSPHQAEYHIANMEELRAQINNFESAYGDLFDEALYNSYSRVRHDIDIILYFSDQGDQETINASLSNFNEVIKKAIDDLT